MDIKKLVVVALLGIGALALVWFIFSPQPEKYEQGSQASNQGQGTLYSSPTFGFQIRVPAGFTVNEAYLNQALGPGKEIPGVEFRIPQSLSAGTNLSQDSHVAVEELSDIDCRPSDFLEVKTTGEPAAFGDNLYMYAESSGVGAGNLYDESVYVTEKGSRCYAIRYFIHSSNIANYEPGAVRAFDRQALVSMFDSMVSSFVIY